MLNVIGKKIMQVLFQTVLNPISIHQPFLFFGNRYCYNHLSIYFYLNNYNPFLFFTYRNDKAIVITITAINNVINVSNLNVPSLKDFIAYITRPSIKTVANTVTKRICDGSVVCSVNLCSLLVVKVYVAFVYTEPLQSIALTTHVYVVPYNNPEIEHVLLPFFANVPLEFPISGVKSIVQLISESTSVIVTLTEVIDKPINVLPSLGTSLLNTGATADAIPEKSNIINSNPNIRYVFFILSHIIFWYS